MSDAFYLDNLDFQGSGSPYLVDPAFTVGAQPDGTYAFPQAAQPVNNPSNTAGYSSLTPDWVGNVLTQGVGVLGQYFSNEQMLDYRRFEATNGGMYQQGRPALLSQNSKSNMNTILIIALAFGAVFLLVKK